jgi:response regulator RpfG family c-di-GMP phosphodiesterase
MTTPSLAEEQTHNGQNPGHKKLQGNILIIDDEPNNLKLLTAMLGKHGFAIQTLTDGEYALHAIKNHIPDVILLDIAMPGMNGYEVCEALKADVQTQEIPVIFISALDDVHNKLKAFESGGVDYISRPFHAREVLARINAHLKLRKMQQEQQCTEAALREAHDVLEQRVQERTAELARANAALQVEIEERIQRACEREAIITVASALRTASSLKEMSTILLEEISVLVRARGALLVMNQPFCNAALVVQGYGIWKEMSGKDILTSEGAMCYVLTTRRSYLSLDAFNDEKLANLNLPIMVQSVVSIPLIAAEHPIGMIMVGSDTPLSTDDMHIVSAIGDMAASALHREQLYEQTQRRLEHIQTLHAIDRTIITSLDLGVMLEMFLLQVTTHLHIDAAAIMLFSQDTLHLDYAASHGFRTTLIRETSQRLGEGLAGRVALQEHMIHIADLRYQTEPACVRKQLLYDEGFVVYYGLPLIARGRVKGVLELFHRSALNPDQEWLEFLNTLTGQASIAIDNAEMFSRLRQSNKDLSRAYDVTIEGWARTLELRDAETEGHCRRVTDLTVRLARYLGVSDDAIAPIRRGAILHDIGKVAIPDAILLKQGALTSEEMAIMQKHTEYAHQLLSPIPFLASALEIPYCHHEKWDGSGYPRGLQGKDIPFSARLFAVVDVWDALCSDRPYRKGWPAKKTADHLHAQAGTHFDPEIVAAFLQMMRQDGKIL